MRSKEVTGMEENQEYRIDDPVSYIIVGRNLHDIRKRNRLKQADVANELGISLTHYSNCERGKRRIGICDMVRFCQLTKAALSEVLDGALTEVRIVPEEETERGYSPEDAWLGKMQQYRQGCSGEARKLMLEVCCGVSQIDRSRLEKEK